MKGERVAVIPARGGSARIPGKNLVELCGRPLLAWTIDAAVESGRFDEVVVSTNDPQVADVAAECGVPPPFLRQTATDDWSPVTLATISTLEQLRSRGREYVSVVQLLPTCPLRRSEHIGQAVDHFEAGSHRFQISCTAPGGYSPWWLASLDDQLRPTPVFPDAMSKRSQDLPVLYCPSGAVWVAEVESLMQSRTFYGPGHIYLPMSWPAALDIDSPQDLQMARCLLMEQENP